MQSVLLIGNVVGYMMDDEGLGGLFGLDRINGPFFLMCPAGSACWRWLWC